MYTRSYKDGEIATLPPHYDGVAFGESAGGEKVEKEDSVQASSPASEGVFSRLLGADIFRGIGFPKIGTEEILLIAAAIFLFFSADGDKECAILLLILVFLA